MIKDYHNIVTKSGYSQPDLDAISMYRGLTLAESEHPRDDDEDIDEGYEEPNPKTHIFPHPYEISADEFNNGGGRFDKETLTYWSGDGVLTDDQEEELDIYDYLG